ncbi:unnamed protein product [Eretmochelys imbricata]
MNMINNTIPVTKFILLDFPSLGWLSHTFLCALLSLAYDGTLAGNLCIVWAVRRDPHLQHLPMYILLGNFTWLEICYVTTTLPWMLSDLVSPSVPISFQACFLPAICHPLRYHILISHQLCWALVASCWLCGFLWFVVPTVRISQLSFCGSNTLDHFLFDPAPLVAASCTPAPQTEQACYALSSLIIFVTILFILASYGLVIRAVLWLHAGAGRHKAFSTCTSHLAMVGLFYGSAMVTYVNPAASGSSGKVVTLFYTVGTPLLNPLIYNLRNKEMKEAERRTLLGKR